jgi:hypothetical protein
MLSKLINRLDTKENPKNMWRFGSYRAATLSLGYKTKHLMLYREVIHHFFMSSIANTQIHCVGRK